MKNNIKKLIVTIFSFALIFIGQNVFASSVWNNAPNDCPDINIANFTTGVGYGSLCWTGTNINADPGQTINVRVYYHNTGSQTATNTRIKLIKNPINGSSTNHSFTAQILSNIGGDLYSSPVTVNIPSSQTANFGSTRWYRNQSQNQASFLNGQNGTEIMSSTGLYIGNISPGWGSQGSVVISFQIGNTQPQACSINNFTANPTSITSGQSSVLSWSTSNCHNVTLDGSNVSLSGNQTVSPNNTTTYTLRGYNSNGILQDTKTASVTVIQQQTCSINNFTANPTSIPSGQSSVLSWSTSNCVLVSLNSTIVSNNGNQTVSPTTTTNYVLRATGSSGSVQTMTVTVTVNPIPQTCKINSFTANPTSITSGQSSVLSWSTSNCVLVSLNSTIVSNNGNQTVSPTTTTNYVLRATGSSGSVQTMTVTVTVNSIPQTCTINSFTANPTSITSGQSSTLSWSVNNCHNITLNNNIVLPFSNQTVSPNNTTTYTLRAYNQNGVLVDTKTVTVTVNPIPQTCTINSFTANPTSITSGQSSTLSWSTSNCNDVTISNLNYNVPTSGIQQVWPTQTTTYILVATSSQGAVQTRSVIVYVDNSNQSCNISNFEADPSSIRRGDSSTLRWSTNGCRNISIQNVGTNLSNNGSITVSPNSTTTYVLSATDINGHKNSAETTVTVRSSGGGGGGGSVICQINDFSASNININSGNPVTLTWDTNNCTNAEITTIGNVSTNGSRVVYPVNTTTYTLTASRSNNIVTRSLTIYTTSTPPVYNSSVVTTVATNISQNTAQLNGLITNTSNLNISTYFEYGTTVNLGMRTSSRNSTGSLNFSEQVSGLSSNTIYFFRAVGEGSGGISRGAIEVFRTLGPVTTYVGGGTTRIIERVVQGTTVYGSTSPVVLRIENKYQMIGVGDVIDYVVFYKNISSSKLTRPLVQVYIPNGITLLNMSRGTYSERDRILSVFLEDLEAGAEGVIYLQARVDSLDVNLAQIVTTAILAYTNPNGAQENAMAYVLNNPRINNNNLGATAFFGNIFGLSLIGWLLLIIFIMLLILLARTFYSRRNTHNNNHQL